VAKQLWAPSGCGLHWLRGKKNKKTSNRRLPIKVNTWKLLFMVATAVGLGSLSYSISRACFGYRNTYINLALALWQSASTSIRLVTVRLMLHGWVHETLHAHRNVFFFFFFFFRSN
jgi:hypothetical protein